MARLPDLAGSKSARAVSPSEVAGSSAKRAEISPGTVLGRYRVTKRIGRGGMGAVYEAKHVDLRVPFAVKVLAPELAQNAASQARFLREALLASRLSHPHVVRVSDYGSAQGLTYFVMECLKGEDLAALLRRTRLTAEQTANLLLPICSAVAETHERGFLHRDLKPSNIFLAQNALGQIVPTLLDFGVAKGVDAEAATNLTQDGALVGTPAYLAPEQVRKLPPTARCDQYALGVILYQCITGKLPFDGPTDALLKAIVAHQFTRPRTLYGDVPRSFEAVVLKAMSARPGGRFASVRALGKALLGFAAPSVRAQWTDYFGGSAATASLVSAVAMETPVRWRPPEDKGATRSNPSPARKRRWARPAVVIAAGSLAVALAVCLAWLAFRDRSAESFDRAAGIPAPSAPVISATSSDHGSSALRAADQVAGVASTSTPRRGPIVGDREVPKVVEPVADTPGGANGRERPAPRQVPQNADRKVGVGYGFAGPSTGSEYRAAGE